MTRGRSGFRVRCSRVGVRFVGYDRGMIAAKFARILALFCALISHVCVQLVTHPVDSDILVADALGI